MDQEVYNTADPKQVKKKKTKWQLDQERNNAELEALINTPGGAYFVHRILSECGVYQAAPEDLNAATRFNGRRDIGLWLMEQLVNINEELYTKVRYVAKDRDGEINR